MSKEILVTGGVGYIGSNVVDLLLRKKYKVVVIDNLSTGNQSLIHPDAGFYKIDILDKAKLEKVFKMHLIDTVIHLATLSSVGESAKIPKKYLKNNAQSETINLGTEKGYSVKEIINLCSKTLKKSVKIKIEPRRKGAPPILIASCEKAKKLLGWEHEKTIHHIIESAWRFEQKLSI